MASSHPILIAGGGPVGLICALALAREGLAVRVFEAEAHINNMPRAATTHAATLEMLADLGLIDEVIARGLVEPKFRVWDRQSGEMVAEFDFGLLQDETPYPFAVQCEQHKLAAITVEKLRSYPHASVEFSTRVAGLMQSNEGVEILVQTAEGTSKIAGSYLIGADGGRSTVRKALGIAFEGYTHSERFLILTTTFDIGNIYPGCTRNYFSSPDDWFALFKVSGDERGPLWRVLSPVRPEHTEADVTSLEAAEHRLHRLIPKKGRYNVIHRNLYNVHQRVAARFSHCRVFLAGDAAHVNNPLGGLGLNFGIHDAIELASLLCKVVRRDVSEDSVYRYDEHRRPLNIAYVQQQTIANKKQMEEKDPAKRAANFEALRRTTADKDSHRNYLLRASLIESVRSTPRL